MTIMNAKHTAAGTFLLVVLQVGCRDNKARDGAEAKPNQVTPTSGSTGAMPKPRAATVEPPPELAQRMPGHPGPARPPPTLWLQPGDLMTAIGDTPVRAWLDNLGSPVDANVLSAVAFALELREYPSMKLVAVDKIEYNPPVITTPIDDPMKSTTGPPAPGSSDERAYVELRPKAPLAKSWHVLSLSSVPSGLRLAPWSAPTPPAGAYAARFHLESQPVLSRMLICKKDAGFHRVVFEFSENVQPVAGTKIEALVKVTQPSTGRTCTVVGSGPIPASSMRWVDQSCENFAETATWTINLLPGLVSPVGRAVTTFDGATAVQRTLDLTALPDVDNTCKAWRP
jgi:hypothetical protein